MAVLLLSLAAVAHLFGINSAANFTVEPVSVVQAEALEAVFECLYHGAIAYSWALNGSFWSDFPPGVVATSPSGDSPARLTISATTQYNNTVVQCEAVIREGGGLVSMLSENATLQVQGPLSPITNLFEHSTNTIITISWTPPFSLNLTTAEPDIQYCVDVYNVINTLVESVCGITEEVYSFTPSNPFCQQYKFTVTPRSNVEGALNGTTSEPIVGLLDLAGETPLFMDQPVSVVQAEGLEAVFECLYPGALLYGWVLNGTFWSDFPPGVVATSPSGGSPARLTIPATTQYNNTVVQCEAVIREGGVGVFLLSCPASLLVQDPLMAVRNLIVLSDQTTIATSWTTPFSLDLTTAEPDIQYCVDVYNVTGGGADLLESVCGITDTSYTFSASDPDQLFNFTVTPRSNVEGSLNGTTSQPVQGFILGVPLPIPADQLSVWSNVDLDPVVLTFPIEVLGTSPGRMPTSYTVSLNHSLSWCTCPTTHTIANSTVELTLVCANNCTLSRHQVYSLTVIATNKAGSSHSFPGLHINTDLQQTTQATNTDIVQVSTENVALIAGGATLGAAVVLLLLCVCITCTCVCRRRKMLGRFDLTQAQHDTPEGLHEIEGAADRVDLSTAFPGIEQPNEAYSTVMNRNIAYEKLVRHNHPHNPPPTESSVGEYEEIEPVHEYEEVLPQRRVNNPQYVNIDTSSLA